VSFGPTIHASAVLVGAHAILIRGPSGAGKSRLALEFIQATAPHCGGALLFTRLVADDRVDVAAAHGRLLARPAPALAGLLEVRGIGIIRLPHEPIAVVSLVVDLDGGERMPEAAATRTCIEGIWLPRLAAAPGNPFPAVLAALTSARSPVGGRGPSAAPLGAAYAAPQQSSEGCLRSALGWS
jgi:serine kinase of HPr protein (carbohydrate metabolism regulator)